MSEEELLRFYFKEVTLGFLIFLIRTVSSSNVRPVVTRWTYGLEPNVRPECDRKTLFYRSSHSSCFLVIELCFSRNITNDRSFLNIRCYEASRELHGGALQSR
jgi:hypothetical protein